MRLLFEGFMVYPLFYGDARVRRYEASASLDVYPRVSHQQIALLHIRTHFFVAITLIHLTFLL